MDDAVPLRPQFCGQERQARRFDAEWFAGALIDAMRNPAAATSVDVIRSSAIPITRA
ncbi:MAG: hypothetical protein QM754_21330 [Tepidisphaeraceae bacterium]